MKKNKNRKVLTHGIKNQIKKDSFSFESAKEQEMLYSQTTQKRF